MVGCWTAWTPSSSPHPSPPCMSSPSSPDRRGVALLGSTGSIGTQAIEVLAAHPEVFRIVGLAAGRDGSTLAEQATQLRPAVVALSEADALAGLNLPDGT